MSYQFIDLTAGALRLEENAFRVSFDPVMRVRAKVRVRVQMWPPAGGHERVHRWSSIRPSAMWIRAKEFALTSIQVLCHLYVGYFTFPVGSYGRADVVPIQASPHNGPQVQNLSGGWVDVPPIPGTFMINIGKGERVLFLSCAFPLPIVCRVSIAGLETAT